MSLVGLKRSLLSLFTVNQLRKKKAPILFFALILITQIFFGSDAFAMKAADVEINGYIGMDMGQFVNARYLTADVNHIWIGSTYGELGLKAVPSDFMSISIDILGRAWVNSFPPETIRNRQFMYSSYEDILVDQAYGLFSFLKDTPLNINIAAGIMDFKYNPEATNLGEYLFRTGCYPAWVQTDFDFPEARITGIRAGLNYKGEPVSAGLDLFALTEMQIRPFHDLSLAGIAHVNIFKILDIGGGFELAHCWAVDGQLTTPVDGSNMYFNDTAHLDTGYYSFAGTKVMARATLDPLFFLRGENGDGAIGNGGKLYGEMAVLGLKDYPSSSYNPYGYDKLSQKMPFMFGFSIPTWKILDECSFEWEYFGCNYPNSYNTVIKQGYPLPCWTQAYQDSMVYAHGDWKWSWYAKKNITKNFAAMFMLGRDHSRWEANGAFPENADFEDALITSKQVAWRLKFLFSF